MKTQDCEHWRGVLAMDVLSKERTEGHEGLSAHLDGCQECRELSFELIQTRDALSFMDPGAPAVTAAVSPALTSAVLGDLNRAARSHRRRRTSSIMALASGGLVAASLAIVAVLSIGAGVTPLVHRTEVLRGSETVTASAVLTEHRWGTSIAFRERGLAGTGVYTVSMETASGRWWSAGTYLAAGGHPVDATMACAVKLQAITGIRVTNASGKVILDSYRE
jgi:hypothetical protein